MSKGRYINKKKSYIPFWLILVIAALLLGAVLLILGSQREDISSKTEGQTVTQTEAVGQTDAESGTTAIGNTEDADAETTPAETATATDPDAAQKPEETKAPQANEVPQPTVNIVQQADAEYEKWLAAAMVMCVSMEYPDFELEAVYAASATSLENKFDSEGAYILFTTGGNSICIHSRALEAERTAAGTKDISTEAIGYATFDMVNPDSVDFSVLEEIDLADLSELFAQSLLVSIYAR